MNPLPSMIVCRIPAVLFFGLFTTNVTTAAVTILNGSFESPIPTGVTTAPASLGAWNVTDGDVFVPPLSPTLVAQQGAQFIFLPGTGIQSADITQTLTGMVTGVEYEISYWLCGWNNQATPQQCSIEIAMFNQKKHTFDFAIPASTTEVGTDENEWTLRQFSFFAEGASTDLQINVFRTNAVSSAYSTFDNFTIRVVPNGTPIVKVKNPKKRRTEIRRSRLELKGSVTSTLPVEFVQVQIGKSTKTAAAGTASWKLPVKLKRGINRIRVSTIDIAGTGSAAVTRIVRREN